MRHAVTLLLSTAVVAIGAASSRAAVADGTPTPGGAGSDAREAPCDAWEVEYSLAGTCAVRDTAMGAANGDWAVGPGTTTVRFDAAAGPGPGPAKLLSFSIKEFFTSVVLGTKFTTDVTDTATPTTTCSAAEGTVAGTKLAWDSKVRAFKIDGSLTCEGAMCGKFGGPPSGKSDYHMPAHDVEFAPWEFAADMKTFTMAASLVSRGDSPKQSTYLTIAGREVKRTCVRAKPCK